MTSVLFAILPIVAILLLGKVIAALQWLTEDGWVGLENVTYFVLFPALIITKLSIADFSQADWRMPVALIGAQLILGGLSIAFAKILNQNSERIGVLVQSAVRWNTFIALALAEALIGPSGLALVAVAAAAMIPTANGLSVLALTGFSSTSLSMKLLTRQVLLNPLIIACLIGILINLSGLSLPRIGLDTLEILAQATIAIGLLATASHIQFSGNTVSVFALSAWSILRLVGLPLVAGGLAIALSVPGDILLVILICTAVPSASNGAILARQLGGDARLSANLIACQTVLTLITFTGVIWMAETLNLLTT